MGISQDRYEHNKFGPIPFIHCHENAWKLHIWPLSLSQNGEKMKKTNKPWTECNQFQRWLGYIVMSNFRPFLPCVLKKIPETTNMIVSLSQNGAKMRNINIPWPKSYLYWRWPEYINKPNLRRFLPCVLKKCPEIANLPCFKMSRKWGKSTDGDQNLSSSQGGQDTPAYWISCHSKWLQ